jgi:hypothetical protein
MPASWNRWPRRKRVVGWVNFGKRTASFDAACLTARKQFR